VCAHGRVYGSWPNDAFSNAGSRSEQDLIALLSGCGDWSFIRIEFVGQANGTLPDGSPGTLQVTETGLFNTAGIANPNSRVALDGFPAEHITIGATGD